MLDSSVDVIVQRFEDDAVPPIMFSQLRHLLERNAGPDEVLAHFPDLKISKLFRAEAYLKAKDRQRPVKSADLHVLCDENVSGAHLRACQQMFGYATHIKFERMAGEPDTAVWQFAVANRFDIILSNDSRNRDDEDLTRIAIESWRAALQDPDFDVQQLAELPRIVHLNGKAKDPERFAGIAASHLKTIFALHADMSAPVMRLSETGVQPGASSFDLLVRQPARPVVRYRRREEIQARDFLNILLPDQSKWRDRESPEVRQIKRQVTYIIADLKRRNQPGFERSCPLP